MKLNVEHLQRSLALVGLIVLALALGMVVVARQSYQAFATHLHLQTEGQLGAIADLKVEELSSWRSERLTVEAEILRRNTFFAEEVQRFLAASRDDAAQRQLRGWLAGYRAHREYTSVSLVSTNGQTLLADSGAPAPVAPAVRAHIADVLASRQVAMVDFYYDDAGAPAALTTLIPIIDPQAGQRVIALVALQIDPQVYLYPYLQQWPAPSASAETLLVRYEGGKLLTLNPLRFSQDTALSPRWPLALAGLLEVAGPVVPSGMVVGLDDYRGEPVLAVVRAVPDSPWLLVAKIDAAEVNAPLREWLWETVLFFTALTAAFGAAIMLILWQRRLRDVRRQIHAAAALQESEARYRTLVDSLDISLCRWLPDTTLVFTNARYRSIFGIGDDSAGLRWLDLLPAAGRAQTAAFYRDLVVSPRTVTYEHPVTVSDGSVRYFQWIDTPILDAAGRVVEFQSVGLDLTERKHAEELVSAQRDLARISSTVSSSEQAWPLCLEIAVRLVGMDSGGLYLFDQDKQTLELVAHLGLDADFVAAASRYGAETLNMRLVVAGKPIYFSSDNVRQLELLQHEGIQSVAFIPIYAQGRPFGALNVCSHTQASVPAFARYALETISVEIGNLFISLQTALSLRESEQQARALVSSLEAEQRRFARVAATVPGAICTFLLSPDGVLSIPYTSGSFEEVFGLSPADVRETSAPLTARVSPEHIAHLRADVEVSARTLQPWRNEYQYQHPVKGEIWLEGYSMPIREEDGSTFWHGVTTDITERKQAEQARLRSSAQLAAVVGIEHALAAATTQEAIYAIVMDGVRRLFSDVATLFISRYDAERGLIIAVAGSHSNVPVDVAGLPALPLAPDGQGTQSRVIRTRRPLIITDSLRDRFRPGAIVVIGEEEHDTQSALYVPMVAQDRVQGLIQLQSFAPGRFRTEDADTLALVANTAAVCLKNVQLYELAQRELAERTHVEATLRASERHFASIFDASPVGIAITRLSDAKVEEVNAAMLAMLGYTREQVVGRTVAELGVWANLEDRQRIVEQLHQSGRITDVETTFCRSTGERRTVLISAELIVLNSEPSTLIQVNDITERKRAEEQLRHSEVRFRALIEHAPGAIALIDAAGTLVFISSSTERVMGYCPDEMLGQDPTALTHPDDLPSLLESLGELMSSPGQVRTTHYRFRHRDGSWRWVESTISNLLHEPSVSAITFNYQDITERKQAELALRASEELYRGLIESLDSVVATVDAAGTFHYMNDVAAQALGGTPQAFIGKTMAELFPAPGADIQLANICKVIREDKALINEAPSLVQGQLRWHRTTIQPIHDETGQVICALINSTDIHDLKTIQQELLLLNQTLEERVRQGTAEVQDLYEHAPTGYHSLDAQGFFIRVNQTVLDWLGYTRDELIGRSFTDILTPADREIFQMAFTAFKVSGQIQDLEYEFVRKDGSTFPVMLSATAIYDDAGNYVMSRSTSFDITRRKAAEAALRESEGQNRLLFEASPEALVLFDERGAMVRVNHAFKLMTGHPGHRLSGHRLDELGLLPEQDSALFVAAMERARLSNDCTAVECKLMLAAGQARDVSVRVFGLLIHGAQHYLAALRDVTAEKQASLALRLANAELARAARAKDEFLANMSHELRTPLNAILGFSESLLEAVYGPLSPTQEASLRHIVTSGSHLLALINDILDLSKAEAGRLELRVEPVSVVELCQASLLFVREQALKKAIRLTLNVEDHALMLEADPVRLKQMLVNLLSNAVKFTPVGGTVHLETTADAVVGVVRLTVHDTGIGIAPADLARLFQPFVQLDSSLNRQHEGTGLGLALVRRLAELHGGSCTAESEAGVGSRFTITLPFQPPWPERALLGVKHTEAWLAGARQAEPPATVAEPVPASARVLLAEDNEDAIQVISDFLHARGYAVVVARNGNEALERAQDTHPALILMDIQMPTLDGLEAIRRLRARPESAATPIIALTALAMPGDRDRCLQAGADEYLTKPVSLKGLVEVINRLLKG